MRIAPVTLATPEDRLRLFGDEILRLAEMYRVACDAHFVQALSQNPPPAPWPRPERLIRPKSSTFPAAALRYLMAVRPNSATTADITNYVQLSIGRRYSAAMCSQTMTQLGRSGKVVAEARGRWRAAQAFAKQPSQHADGRPEINGPGLLSEVRRLILAYGPLDTRQLLQRIGLSFSIGGEDPANNLRTILGKSPDIVHWYGVGYVLLDLVNLEPTIRHQIRPRRASHAAVTARAFEGATAQEVVAVLAEEMSRARAAGIGIAAKP